MSNLHVFCVFLFNFPNTNSSRKNEHKSSFFSASSQTQWAENLKQHTCGNWVCITISHRAWLSGWSSKVLFIFAEAFLCSCSVRWAFFFSHKCKQKCFLKGNCKTYFWTIFERWKFWWLFKRGKYLHNVSFCTLGKTFCSRIPYGPIFKSDESLFKPSILSLFK